jgi:MHS family shikimate/dehydroshikimate transporter-like MFS transporter
LFVRLSVDESPVFEAMQAAQAPSRMPLVDVLRRQWRVILLVIGMHLANTVIAYLGGVFMLNYTTTSLGVAVNMVLLVGLIAHLVVAVFVAMPAAALGDRIGRRPVYLMGTVGLAVVAFPMFWLYDTGQFALMLVAALLGGVANVLMYQTQGAFFTELFDPDVRCTGAALGVQVATVIGGGTAPLIATALLSLSGGNSGAIAVYLIGIAAVSTISTLLVKVRRPADVTADRRSVARA